MFFRFNAGKRPFAVVLITLILLWSTSVIHASHITIDGTLTDWAGAAGFIDPGGADDETSPARADITEFRAAAETSGIYLLMAWDNTSFVGGNATTAGITFLGANGTYYRIYATASGNPGTVTLADIVINSCTNSSCSSETTVCTGAACTAVQVASNTNWVDPFASRSSPGCTGTNCGTLDTAVELYIPWSLIGGQPTEGQRTFANFDSYPSGPGNGQKDGTGPNGISCSNTGGTLNCYPSTPTAVSLHNLTGTETGIVNMVLPAAAIGLLLLTTLFLVARRRA